MKIFLCLFLTISLFCYGNRHEFELLEEFSLQQLIRQRAPLKGIDRYAEWVPFSDNNVSLHDGRKMSASFIYPTGKKNEKYHDFIASQAPMQDNIHLFWQMIWEQEVTQVVMTTELYEEDGEELCATYWPKNLGEKLICENGIEVTFIEEKWLLAELQENIQIRKFQVNWKHQNRLVTHYWYHNWPDDAAPKVPRTMTCMIETVQRDKASSKTTVPILVHCAAGVGRTGVFIVLYHIAQRAKNDDFVIPLFELVANLRWQRQDMVGELAQYEFCLINSSSVPPLFRSAPSHE